MEEKATYINHPLNTSCFRNTCRFSKAQRFSNQNKTYHTEFNYYVGSRPSSRSTNFGIGNRNVNSSLNYVPGPDRYNVSKFPVDQRGAKLGYNREQAIFGSITHQVQRKAQLPSPDTYNNVEIKGKSYSLRMKLPGQLEFAVKKRVPGPGQYKTLQLNPAGRYVSSRIKNTRAINFGIPSTDRPLASQNIKTGPGSYDIFNLDSNFSDTKVTLMRRNTTKNFGTSNRHAVEDKNKVSVPGPGQYESFSCFGNGFKPRIS